MRTNFKLIFSLLATFAFAFACTDVDELRDYTASDDEVTDDEDADSDTDSDTSTDSGESTTMAIFSLDEITSEIYPDSTDVWCISDVTATTASTAGLRTAAYAALKEGREIELIFANMKEIPDSILYINNSSDLTNITSVTAPVAVKVGNYAFLDNTGIVTIDMPNLQSVGVCSFQWCSSITEIDFPYLTSIDSCGFYRCESAAYVNLPSVKTLAHGALRSCSSLTEIYLPEVTTASSYTFYNCNSVVSISTPKLETIIGDDGSLPYATFMDCSSVEIIDMPLLSSGIYERMFETCVSLKEVNFPKVSSVGNLTFRGLYNLETVNLASATDIGQYAFRECISLTYLEIGTDCVIDNLSSETFFVTGTDGYAYSEEKTLEMMANINITIGSANSSMVNSSAKTLYATDESKTSATVLETVEIGPFKSITVQ